MVSASDRSKNGPINPRPWLPKRRQVQLAEEEAQERSNPRSSPKRRGCASCGGKARAARAAARAARSLKGK